uniref:Uncharacterized protein n=1 Tax=Lepeophtheirus salmonis TaxID=72036 RepID=A0A0K2T2C5_LEPSM
MEHSKNPRRLPFSILRASSLVSGRDDPIVSGNPSARTPATEAMIPTRIMGRGPHTLLSSPIIKAQNPPNRATQLQHPMAVLRIFVGKSSAAYTKTIAKHAVPPNFPRRKKNI